MKSVVICGSKRFTPEIRSFASRLRESSVIVFEPYLHAATKEEWERLSDDQKKFIALGLTHDYFYKIDMADVVFLYNKDGYCGNSGTLELGYAVAAHKPIYALTDDEEICRHVLFRKLIASPEELIKQLV